MEIRIVHGYLTLYSMENSLQTVREIYYVTLYWIMYFTEVYRHTEAIQKNVINYCGM